MKNTYTLTFVATMLFALSSIANSEDILIVKASPNTPSSFSFLSDSKGHFCSVSGANVCVLTQSHEDCLKLGGQKVGSCKQRIKSSTTAEHSDHSGDCMSHEDSQEPVSCYGF